MYVLTRHSAAQFLNVSTRTIDRYVRRGRIRFQKDGKQILLHQSDIEILKNQSATPLYEIVSPQSDLDIHHSPLEEFREVIDTLQQHLTQKDALIQELSFKLGKAESELKNSISLLEYKKTTHLLETAKSKTQMDNDTLKKMHESMKHNFRTERMINMALLVALTIVLALSVFIWVTGL